VRVLIVTWYFPPAGGGGVQRPLKLATHLPELGIQTHVLAPDDSKWVHRDEELALPERAQIHRARYIGPGGRKRAEELHGRHGLDRLRREASLFSRRLIVPDENAPWLVTAIPAAIRIVRREKIDVVLTTSPPGSVHLVGAAVRAATKAKWVADLRDSLVAHPHMRAESRLVRTKELGQRGVARVVAKRADAIACVSEAIAAETEALRPRGRVVTIANGSDFDDFAGLDYVRGERFRITHTGSFFGKRDPRPFLSALKASGLDDVVVRFVGDFRAADREWLEAEGLAAQVELIPYVPRRRSLELQRDSEALLLLIPEAGGRGKGVLSGKVFEYLAAERPVLGAVPTDGAAAELLRDLEAGPVVGPEDVDGLRAALLDLHGRWRDGSLAAPALTSAQRDRIDRSARVRELAELMRSVV
jgi:glycosyltransferase involved in cell wall biosynthesis